MAQNWPNITIKREPPADAKEWDGKPGKFEAQFSPEPGRETEPGLRIAPAPNCVKRGGASRDKCFHILNRLKLSDHFRLFS